MLDLEFSHPRSPNINSSHDQTNPFPASVPSTIFPPNSLNYLIQIILLGFETHFSPHLLLPVSPLLRPLSLFLLGLHSLTRDERDEDDKANVTRVFVFQYVPIVEVREGGKG